MKGKVYVVSKSHLDMGYTDLAETVVNRYLTEFIPRAVKIAREVNTGTKKFVWTIGSWLIEKGLEDKDEERAKALFKACERGDIVAHAMPFTVQSELMDERLLSEAVKKIKDLDAKFGRKTIAAKMTDVPGHTKGLVKILADNGIKFLHIGVNSSSAVPDVPPCFRWRCDGREIIVAYEGSYGKKVCVPGLDDMLVFDHSMDNCGPKSAEKVLKNFRRLQRKFKGYEVVAGTMDDFAEKLWDVKETLPVFEGEIGDSWIHGAASDPYKYGGLISLCRWREKLIKDGRTDTSEKWYKDFEDNLMCVAEHTSGLGILRCLKDYDNYSRDNFEEARVKDKRIPRYGIYALPVFKKAAERCAKKGVYSAMEESWKEQRGYLDKAVKALPETLRKEAEEELKRLRPANLQISDNLKETDEREFCFGKWSVSINDGGAPYRLACEDKELISGNTLSLVEYVSLSKEDYAYWLNHYQRDLYKTFTWAIPDFGRPKLGKAKYAKGRFAYTVKKVYKGENTLAVEAVCEKLAYETLGMPEKVLAEYTFSEETISLKVSWFNKKANRLPEEIWLHLPFACDSKSVRYTKLGVEVSPFDIVRNGGINLSVAEGVSFISKGINCTAVCSQCAPVSLGSGKLLKYDNVPGDGSEGFSYLLYNNVWGTNYPLWYEDNAMFEWKISFDM